MLVNCTFFKIAFSNFAVYFKPFRELPPPRYKKDCICWYVIFLTNKISAIPVFLFYNIQRSIYTKYWLLPFYHYKIINFSKFSEIMNDAKFYWLCCCSLSIFIKRHYLFDWNDDDVGRGDLRPSLWWCNYWMKTNPPCAKTNAIGIKKKWGGKGIFPQGTISIWRQQHFDHFVTTTHPSHHVITKLVIPYHLPTCHQLS